MAIVPVLGGESLTTEIMEPAPLIPCPNCERLQAQLEVQRLQIEALQAAVARLQEQLAAARKDSSTSSKPPSSDIVKPPPPPLPPGQDKRKHRRPARPSQARTRPVPPEQIDPFLSTPSTAAPAVAAQLRRNGHFARVVQQVDFEPAAVDRRAAHLPRILVRPLPARPTRPPCPATSTRAAWSARD